MHKMFYHVRGARLLASVLAIGMMFISTSLLDQHVSGQYSTSDQEAWQWLDTADGHDTVTLLLMGDTNIQDREDPGDAYKYVLPTLRAADVRFANLEGAFAGTSKDPLMPDIPHKQDW